MATRYQAAGQRPPKSNKDTSSSSLESDHSNIIPQDEPIRVGDTGASRTPRKDLPVFNTGHTARNDEDIYNSLPPEYQRRLENNPYRNTEPTQGIFEPWSKFQARWNAWRAQYDEYVAKIYDEYLISTKSSAQYQTQEQIAAGIRPDNIQVDSSLSSQAMTPQDVNNNPEQYNVDYSDVFGAIETSISVFSSVFTAGITGASTIAALNIAEKQAAGLDLDNTIKVLNSFDKANTIIGNDFSDFFQNAVEHDGEPIFDTGNSYADGLLRNAWNRRKTAPKSQAKVIDAQTELTNSATNKRVAERKNIEEAIRHENNYTIRDDAGNVVQENATLAEFMRHMNILRNDSYQLQELIDMRQSILDGIEINNTMDYYREFRKQSGVSFGTFQARTDYNLQKAEQDLNECINKMRESVYNAFDWLYKKAEQGNGFAIAGCATLGSASFTLPRTMVSNFAAEMSANRREKRIRKSQTNLLDED